MDVAGELAIRGAVSTGFRAPSLNQIWFNNVSTQFVIDPATNQLTPARVLTVNNLDPVTRAFGVPKLEEETSVNLSGGVIWRPTSSLSVTGDAYWIGIRDRVVLSSRFSDGDGAIGADVAQILAPFASLGVGQAQFFANAVDTETLGVDVVVNWVTSFREGTLNVTGSANITSTEVVDINVPVSMAQRFTQGNLEAVKTVLFNREERNRLETALPRTMAHLGGRYTRGPLHVGLGANYFGEVLYRPTNSANDEDFGGKLLVDADVSWQLPQGVTVEVGANNLLNTFPDRHQKVANISSGNFPYSRRVTQFGMNGAFYFVRLGFTVGG